MSASEDYSECSSASSGSPYSASQTVPNSSSGISSVDGAPMCNGDGPYLRIIEHPQEFFRFRYRSEREQSSHGFLQGESSDIDNRTFPMVELMNYSRKAVIKCRLFQATDDEEHPHKLMENESDDNIPSINVPDEGSYIVCFEGLEIIHTSKKEVTASFMKKYASSLGHLTNKQLKARCNNIDLNIVRLRFSGHDPDAGTEICPPVYSKLIKNSKSTATNKLKICRYNIYSGKPEGGEDVYLLVDKFTKNNIRIQFFELDEHGERIWQWPVNISESDCHHQCAIVFRTPRYRDTKITKSVKVWFELYRPTDGATSEPREFKYLPDKFHTHLKSTTANSSDYGYKKRKMNSVSSSPTHSTVSGSSTQSMTVPRGMPMSPLQNQPSRNFIIAKTQMQQRASQHGHMQPSLDNFVHVPASPALSESLSSEFYDLTDPDKSPLYLASQDEGAVMEPFSNACDAQIPDYIDDHLVSETGDAAMEDLLNGVQITDYVVDPIHHILEPLNNEAVEKNQYYITSNEGSSDVMKSSPLIHDPMLGQASLPAQEDLIDPKEIESFMANNWSQYFNNDMVTDSEITWKRDPLPKPMSEVTSTNHKENSESKLEERSSHYSAYYTAQDGIKVKKLIKEICEVATKDGCRKDVASKLEGLFDMRLSNGDTFLHMTLSSHRPSFEYIVKLIHSMKMPHLLNLTNDLGQSILHLALLHDLPRLVALLVARGCDPMIPDCEGNNAVHYAARRPACLEIILDAVMDGHACDLDAYNTEKQTALHVAVIYDMGPSVGLLLRHGASRTARDLQERAPLHLAARDDSLAAAAALLEHMPKIEVDMVDGQGRTALQIVTSGPIKKHSLDIAKLLLEKKADPLRSSGKGNRPALRLAKREPQMRQLLQRYTRARGDGRLSSDDEFQSADEGDPEEISSRMMDIKLN